MPYLSVIIPLYNKEKQIKRTIDSVLCQEFKDFELIIVNDGSTDKSMQIVEEITDCRIRLINQPNAGVSSARNRGIYESTGDFLFLLDADDNLMPGAFNILFRNIKADIIVASYLQSNNNGIIICQKINSIIGMVPNPFEALWKREISMRMGNFFVKKALVEKVGGLRNDITLYEDHEWNIRLLEFASLYSSDKLILNYNRGNEGLSSGFRPIEKDYAFIASVKGNKDKYKRRIIACFVFRRLVIRLIRRDWHGVKCIWSNNNGRLLYCMTMYIIRPHKK